MDGEEERVKKEITKTKKWQDKQFWGKRKKYEAWCEREREKYERREEEKIRMIKTESEAWKYINRYGERKQREKTDKSIEMKNWKSHFMELLEGQARKQDKTGTQRRRGRSGKRENNKGRSNKTAAQIKERKSTRMRRNTK